MPSPSFLIDIQLRGRSRGTQQPSILTSTPTFLTLAHLLTNFHSESPYPEVRTAVASVDDPNMPVNTFRMWFLGIFFSMLISGLNMVFALRCMYIGSPSYHLSEPVYRPCHLHYRNCCPARFTPLWPWTCPYSSQEAVQHFRLQVVVQPWPFYHQGARLYHRHG